MLLAPSNQDAQQTANVDDVAGRGLEDRLVSGCCQASWALIGPCTPEHGCLLTRADVIPGEQTRGKKKTPGVHGGTLRLALQIQWLSHPSPRPRGSIAPPPEARGSGPGVLRVPPSLFLG
jgi:hypothetical protein